MNKIRELDHGLPLSYLKMERRRLVELTREDEPSDDLLSQIATVQASITAVEAVIVELDADLSH